MIFFNQEHLLKQRRDCKVSVGSADNRFMKSLFENLNSLQYLYTFTSPQTPSIV